MRGSRSSSYHAKGGGMMSVDGVKDVELIVETLYYEPAGCTFRIRNTGAVPLEVLITLIRVEPAATRSESA